MFPYADENPTLRPAVATIAIIAAMAIVWVFAQGGGLDNQLLAATVCNWGLVPAELTKLRPVGFGIPIAPGLACVIDSSAINWATPFLSLFLHGSWGHLLSNALFLWVFGNNVEDVMGRGRFIAFYLVCGLVASAAHLIVDPASPVPTVGASGAISGALGAYLIRYPGARVRTFFPPIFFVRLPAWMILIGWFGIQFLSGLPQLISPSPAISGGVAVWAHVGGFLAGVLLSRAFENPELVAARREARFLGGR